jgi:hypothetical protein
LLDLRVTFAGVRLPKPTWSALVTAQREAVSTAAAGLGVVALARPLCWKAGIRTSVVKVSYLRYQASFRPTRAPTLRLWAT